MKEVKDEKTVYDFAFGHSSLFNFQLPKAG
jgi:hypothetical protein